MKKYMTPLIAAAFCLLCACGQTSTAEKPDNTPTVQENADIVNETSDPEIEDENRKLIANALGTDEDARSVRFISNALDMLKVGRIQSAEMTQENGEDVLDIMAEEGRGSQN